MENNAKQVVFNFLNAVKDLDLETVGALLSPVVSWSQPGNNQLSGLKDSREAVFQMVGQMFELSNNTLKLAEFKAVSSNGNRVACLLTWTASNNAGNELNVNNIDVYTVESGLISEVEVFTADEAQEDGFWGK